MSWLEKLKTLQAIQKIASPQSCCLQKLHKEVLVVSVGSLLGTCENLSNGNSVVKSVQTEDSKLAPAFLTLLNKEGDASNSPVASPAWSAIEIDTFICRRHRFTEKRLDLEDAEAVAETLLLRDREIDNRRLCLECVHLQGDAQRGWRCKKVRSGNGQSFLAAHPIYKQGMVLPLEYVHQLQRCHGFQEAV